MDLIDIYRTFHPKEAKYTLFSDAYGTFSKIDHMVGDKKASTNARKSKSYQAFSRITMIEIRKQPQGKNLKTFIFMETE